MNLKNLNEKQKILLVTGSGVFILIGSIFVLYQTRGKKTKIIKNQVSSLETKIVEVARAKQDIEKFEEEIKSIQKNLKKVQEQLPEEKELPELLGKLAELASTFPTRDYVSVVPGGLEDLGTYYKLPITIKMQCTYSNLQTYLQRLENLPRLIKTEHIEIIPAGENPVILFVNLEINVYYLK